MGLARNAEREWETGRGRRRWRRPDTWRQPRQRIWTSAFNADITELLCVSEDQHQPMGWVDGSDARRRGGVRVRPSSQLDPRVHGKGTRPVLEDDTLLLQVCLFGVSSRKSHNRDKRIDVEEHSLFGWVFLNCDTIKRVTVEQFHEQITRKLCSICIAMICVNETHVSWKLLAWNEEVSK